FLDPRFSFGMVAGFDSVALGMFLVVGVAISFVMSGRPRAPEQALASVLSPHLLQRLSILTGGALSLGILASVLWTGFQRTTNAERWVEHTYQVLNAAAAARSYLEQAQTSERGFLLSGEDQFIEAFQKAAASEREARDTLRRLTVDNAVQQRRLDEFDSAVQARLDSMAQAISARKQRGAAAVPELVRTLRGGTAMEQLRATLDAIDEEERLLLHRRSAAASAEDSRLRWILGLGSGSLVLLLVLAGAAIERNLHQRKQAERRLAQQAQLIDLSHDAIITADGDRIITGWNAGAQEMYGWSEQEAIGKRIHALLRTRSDVPIPEIDRILGGQERWDGELI